MTAAKQQDPWAWAHEEVAPLPDPVGAARVTAVLVAHNGDQWLGRALVGLARLTQRPGTVIGVDADSTDGSAAILQRAREEGILDAVLTAPAGNLGAAVNAALAEHPLHPEGWLWLLHDDTEPQRSCLTHLLRAASAQPAPDLLVPKLLHPRLRNHPDQIGEVGESISLTGARVTSTEPGDIDQRQHEAAPVLGGSTAGMFIRAGAWQQLGGLEPTLPLFRAGVDLGWRANEAGLVVRSCPEAAVYHSQAGRGGLRETDLARRPDAADRVAGMRVVRAHSHRPRLSSLGLQASTLTAALAALIGKSPSRASDEMAALRGFRADRALSAAHAARVSAARLRPVPAGLRPNLWWGWRRTAEKVAGGVEDRYLVHTESEISIDELTAEEYVARGNQRRWLSPALLCLLLVVVCTGFAVRGTAGLGQLVGPRLLPAPAGLTAVWDAWLRPQAGSTGFSAPWTGIAALASTLTLGQPEWFTTALIWSGVGLAALSCYRFLRHLLGSGWLSLTLALLWGLLLPVTGALGEGQLDVIALAVVLPLLFGAAKRWLEGPVTGSAGLQAPGSVALWTTVLAGMMPLSWLLGSALALGCGWVRKDRRGMVVAIAGPLLVLGSWLTRLLAEPGRWLTGIDPAAVPAGTAPGVLAMLAGREPGTTTWAWLGYGLVALIWLAGLAAAGTLDEAEWPTAVRRGLLGIGLLAPLIGLGVSRLVVTIGAVAVRPTGRAWVLIGLFALLVLIALRGASLPDPRVAEFAGVRVRRGSAAERLVARWSPVGFGLLVAAAGAWWVWGSMAPLQRVDAELPGYLTAVQAEPRSSRALVITISGGTATWSLSQSDRPQWGAAEFQPTIADPRARAELLTIVQQIASAEPSEDLAERAQALAISHIWLRGATEQEINALSDAPNLDAAAGGEGVTVLTVGGLPSRAVLSQGGEQTALADRQVPAGGAGRIVLISEPADPRLRVSVSGQPLATTPSPDWRAAYALDDRSGQLSWRMAVSWPMVVWQLLGSAVLLVLAAPTAAAATQGAGPRRARQGSDEDEPTARRSA